jgi:ferritin
MDKKLYEELNKQIQEEFYASYLYLSMSNWLENNNFRGMAHWMVAQYKEEVTHALKIREILNDRGMKVNLLPIVQVPVEFKSPLDCFEAALKHEQHVTARFNMLTELAQKVKDHAAEIALQWFVTEQVEEEKNATEAIAMLQMAGTNVGALMMLDSILGKRG